MSYSYIITSNGGFYSSDYLYHHGIKGMRWGVRRYQNPDGSLTAAGKKRVSQRRPDDIVIKKGTQLNNVGSKENLKLRGNVKGVPNPFGPSAVALSLPLSAALGNPLPAVAAIGTSVIPVKRSDNEKKLFVYREDDPHDKDVYEGAFTKFIKYRDSTNQIFKRKFENIDDLVSPSAQRRAELFVETYRENPKLYSELLNRTDAYAQARKVQGVKYSPSLESFIGKAIFDKNTSDIDLKRYGYGLFNMGNEWNDSLTAKGNNKYYKKLKKSGYNALIDDNNAGIYNDAHEPLIVLNAKKYLKNIGSERLTPEYMADAEKRLRSYMKDTYGNDSISI